MSSLDQLTNNQLREAIGILFQFLGEFKRIKIKEFLKLFKTLGHRASCYKHIGISKYEAIGDDRKFNMAPRKLHEIIYKTQLYGLLTFFKRQKNENTGYYHNLYDVSEDMKDDLVNLGKLCSLLLEGDGTELVFKENFDEFVDVFKNALDVVYNKKSERINIMNKLKNSEFLKNYLYKQRLIYNALSYEDKLSLIYTLNNRGFLTIREETKYHIKFYIGDFRVILNKSGDNKGGLIMQDYRIGFDLEHYFYNNLKYNKI